MQLSETTLIEELNTANRNYKSFHIQVTSTESEKILNPKNWPTGIQVKRFFISKFNSQKDGSMNNENPDNSDKQTKRKC